MICRKLETEFKKAMPDLLLDPERVPAAVRTHVDECADCRKELAELQATMTALDGWEAVEPSPFFDARMVARMKEERAARPAGLLERIRTRMAFGSNHQMRALAMGALAVLMLIGGGTYAGLQGFRPSTTVTPSGASATVRDLQSMDTNAQLFQQMDSLDQPEGGSGAQGAGSH